MLSVGVFFFCKQKTAYEVRISDWCSDVCSSDLPNVAEQYVHRIGRTARAGSSGVAISFCADDERPYLRHLERVTRQKVTIEPLPADFVAQSHEIQATRKIGRASCRESVCQYG